MCAHSLGRRILLRWIVIALTVIPMAVTTLLIVLASWGGWGRSDGVAVVMASVLISIPLIIIALFGTFEMLFRQRTARTEPYWMLMLAAIVQITSLGFLLWFWS